MSALPRRLVHLPHLISASIDLAQRAGHIIRNVFESGHLGAIDKAASILPHQTTAFKQHELNDPQTLADLSSQRLIISSLARAFPHLQLVGEEGEIEAAESESVVPQLTLVDHLTWPKDLTDIPIEDVVVWVDPLDGTKEYTLGHLDGVTVLIGVSVKGRAVAGIIGQPFTNHVVYGAVGVGTFGIKKHAPQPHSVPAPPEPSKNSGLSNYPRSNLAVPAKRALVTTRSHFTPLLAQLVGSVKPTELIRSGGAGSKALMLMGGTADVYYFPSKGLKAWDCVACDACITAAGGKCTDAFGDTLTYSLDKVVDGYQNEQGLIATMKPEDHAYYCLPKEIDLGSKL